MDDKKFKKKRPPSLEGGLLCSVLVGVDSHLPGVAAVEQVVHALVFADVHLLFHLLFVELGRFVQGFLLRHLQPQCIMLHHPKPQNP